MSNNRDLSRDGLLRQLRDVASHLEKDSVSRSEFLRISGIREYHVLKHFESWNDFVRSADLHPIDVGRIPDDELFSAMLDTFTSAGGIVTRTKFRKVCRYSTDVFNKRWGRWENVLQEFRKWVQENRPDFPYVADLPSPLIYEQDSQNDKLPDAKESYLTWDSTGSRHYGPFINFRGLQHAPVNEQGVVFLFGMVAQDLGYVVESVATGFPDCEAKRRTSKSGASWGRVRIEFEYRSRNFYFHGHDSRECDVIVCWEHDWPDCPIEVLELKSAIASLSK